MTTEVGMVQLGEWDVCAKQAIAGDTATAQSAAGTTQATAAPIRAGVSMFGTVAAGAGAVFANEGAARKVVFNGGANALLVYPPVGGAINGAAANAGFSVGAGKGAMFITSDGVTWVALLSA